MFQGGIVRAHGGQGAVAGRVVELQRINAVLRGTTQTIRVWQGHGDAEEFTVREAEALCMAGDRALMNPEDRCQVPGHAALYAGPGEDGLIRPLIISRIWLVGFLAALRRALRTAHAAQAMAPARDQIPMSTCVDTDSEPGSWARHLRHTAVMRGGVADSS